MVCAEVTPRLFHADRTSRARPKKRIEHHAASRAPGQDAGADQIRGKRRKVGIGERMRGDAPHGAAAAGIGGVGYFSAPLVSAFGVHTGTDGVALYHSCPVPFVGGLSWGLITALSGVVVLVSGDSRLPHGLMVVVIALRLGKEKKVLVCARGPVPHTFRHGVRLRPYTIATQIPARILQREGYSPRDTGHVFVFQAVCSDGRGAHVLPVSILVGWRCGSMGPFVAVVSDVRIAQIQP